MRIPCPHPAATLRVRASLLVRTAPAGGLASLLVATRVLRSEDDPAAARALGVFSRLAVVSVTALVGAGVVLGWLNVRSLDALISTAYGRTLLVKLALAAAVVAVGAYNNRVLVPAMTSSVRSAGELVTVGAPVRPRSVAPADDGLWRRLFSNVRWELAGHRWFRICRHRWSAPW